MARWTAETKAQPDLLIVTSLTQARHCPGQFVSSLWMNETERGEEQEVKRRGPGWSQEVEEGEGGREGGGGAPCVCG